MLVCMHVRMHVQTYVCIYELSEIQSEGFYTLKIGPKTCSRVSNKGPYTLSAEPLLCVAKHSRLLSVALGKVLCSSP